MSLKSLWKPHLLCFFPFFSNENQYDLIYDPNEAVKYPDATVSDRLKNLFRRPPEQPLSPMVISMTQTAGATFFVGGIYGGIKSSRITFINFIEANQATQFRNHYEAKRMLSDKMILGFVRGFISMGSKVSFFATTFVTTYLLSSAILNKTSILNYTMGGLITGAIYKFPLGPKGMAGGGFFGSLFGSLYGVFKVISLKIMNATELDIVNKRFEMKEKRALALAHAERKKLLQDENKELKEIVVSDNLLGNTEKLTKV